MTMKKTTVVLGILAVVALGVALWRFAGVDSNDGESGLRNAEPTTIQKGTSKSSVRSKRGREATRHDSATNSSARATEASAPVDETAEEEESAVTEEERLEREEAKLVESFDALTDKWMQPSKDGVTMKDVDYFAEQFRRLPQNRKDECIHRALNLVPDENVMLLAGILMDKSQDREIVETVFNDVLNRNEDVKKPILQQIFKDREHPCWTDTAWILDVTGELPSKKR